jgi:hypothetical protein
MYAIHKLNKTKYVVLALTETHCQCLMPANENHTYFIAEWVPRDMVNLIHSSQSDSFFCGKAGDVLETAAEKLDQLHLK